MNGTHNLCLTLSIIKWFVDASYVIHNYCQGHTGAMMTMGEGAVTSFSCKQKTNAKSSTKVELIGINDALPQILRTRCFFKKQEHTITSNVLYQDNQSIMIMEKMER